MLKNIFKFNLSILLLLSLFSIFIFEGTNAQLHLELRFGNKFTECVRNWCLLHFCFKPIHDSKCFIDRVLEFKHTGDLKLDQLLIPLNTTFNNASIQVEIEDSQPTVVKFGWSGKLSKQWQELDSSGLTFRLQCSPKYFGPFCLHYCDSSRPNVECNEETGERSCVEGYRGSDCSEPIDCNRRCFHGKCSVSGDCMCLPGYEGSDCSIRASTCNAIKPCQNGGSCLNRKNGAYECRCPPGFDGSQCERKMATCAHENPCRNGAECEQEFGRPLKCKCPPDYHGTYCQTWARNCSSLPCQNNAHCVPLNSTFGCVCQSGFSGKICDERLAKCSLNTCSNGGTCLENPQLSGGIECRCKPGYFGTYCEMIIFDCRSSKCINGGVCQHGISHSQCQCPQGYTGNFCEYEIKSMELKVDSSTLAWLLPICFAMLCFALITIGGIWFVHCRYSRWTHNYFDTLWANLWFAPHQRQPPKIKPPSTPISLQTSKCTEKLLDDEEKNENGKVGKNGKQILSADALCQNFYVDEPSLCTKVVISASSEILCQRNSTIKDNSTHYSSVDTLYSKNSNKKASTSSSNSNTSSQQSRRNFTTTMTLRQTSIAMEDLDENCYAEISNE